MSFGGALETNLTITAMAGDTVTADSTIHTKGAWQELVAVSAEDCDGFIVAVQDVAANNTNTAALIEIGVGAVSSEVVVAGNLNMGHARLSGLRTIGPRMFWCPVKIASGARVSVRMQSVIVSHTASVLIWLIQLEKHVAGASSAIAYGASTSDSRGTVVSPGDPANTWGPWTEIGAGTSEDHNLFTFGWANQGDASVQSNTLVFQFGHGGTTTPATIVEALMMWGCSTADDASGPWPTVPIFADVPSGDRLWVRLAAEQSVEDHGVIIHGMECEVQAGAVDGIVIMQPLIPA